MSQFVKRSLAFATLAIATVAGLACAGNADTDDILRVLPPDMAACLVLEDVGDHFDQIRQSETFHRLLERPVIQQWKESSTYRGFESIVAFLPVYFGVSNETLIHDIFGESVVLAFRPGQDGSPAVGIFACRAKEEKVLAKMVDRLTRPNPNREVTPCSYRETPFFERKEFGDRRDFLLRLGSIAILSDKREAIEQVIDASLDGKGLYDTPVFRKMRESTGTGAIAQLLVDTAAFEPLLERAVSEASGPVQYFARTFLDIWRGLDWAVLSVRIDDHLEVSLYGEVKSGALDEEEQKWLALLEEPSLLWDTLPADAILAAATKLDAVSLGKRFCDLAEVLPELGMVVNAFRDLTVGFEKPQQVLEAVGPEVGVVVGFSDDNVLEVFAEIQIRDEAEEGNMGLSLGQTLELVILRPLLVFYSIEHNHDFADTSRVATITDHGLRIHALTGSKVLPGWLSPGFAVTGDRIYLGSSPTAIIDGRNPTEASWVDSAAGKTFVKALGENEVPKAFLNVNRLREFMTARRAEIAGDIAHSTAVTESRAGGKLDDLTSMLELIDFAVLSTSTEGSVRRWTFSAFSSAGN